MMNRVSRDPSIKADHLAKRLQAIVAGAFSAWSEGRRSTRGCMPALYAYLRTMGAEMLTVPLDGLFTAYELRSGYSLAEGAKGRAPPAC